jgi:hypothetical protein
VKTTTKEATAAPFEVEVLPEAPLVRVERADPTVGGLAWEADPRAVIQKMADTVEALQRAAISLTFPTDWVAGKDKEGNVVCTLRAAGCSRVEMLLGLRIDPIPPAIDLTPEPIDLPGGERGERVRGWVSSATLRTERMEVEITRGGGEDFVGRLVGENGKVTTSRSEAKGGYPPDLRASARTGLRAKATRTLLGLKALPPSRLDEVWKMAGLGDSRKASMIAKGTGYGTGTERSAGRVADESAKGSAEELRVEILKRVGGDEGAARQLVKEITANPEKGFGGNTSTAQLTQDWMVDRAWKALRKHPTFGDSAKGASEREPGEDG